MEEPIPTLVCPECGEKISIDLEDIELHAHVICEACYAPLEVIQVEPIVLQLMDVDLDEFDEDTYDEDEDLADGAF